MSKDPIYAIPSVRNIIVLSSSLFLDCVSQMSDDTHSVLWILQYQRHWKSKRLPNPPFKAQNRSKDRVLSMSALTSNADLLVFESSAIQNGIDCARSRPHLWTRRVGSSMILVLYYIKFKNIYASEVLLQRTWIKTYISPSISRHCSPKFILTT